uniref:L antigen family member 3 n=2 Tax=Parascaris univalens TaxID=6257 RepID=A0A915BE40_PARUN
VIAISVMNESIESSFTLNRVDDMVVEFSDESDEESEMKTERELTSSTVNQCVHSAVIRIDLESSEAATMICRTLAVDKEPMRSTATRILSTEGSVLVVNISSSDRKYLQKSVDNFFDMCDLAKQTYDIVGGYELNTERETIARKKKKIVCKSSLSTVENGVS